MPVIPGYAGAWDWEDCTQFQASLDKRFVRPQLIRGKKKNQKTKTTEHGGQQLWGE
jgi:hypothetical protein